MSDKVDMIEMLDENVENIPVGDFEIIERCLGTDWETIRSGFET